MLAFAASFILAINATPNPMISEGATTQEVHFSPLSEGWAQDVQVCHSHGLDCVIPVETMDASEWAYERNTWR